MHHSDAVAAAFVRKAREEARLAMSDCARCTGRQGCRQQSHELQHKTPWIVIYASVTHLEEPEAERKMQVHIVSSSLVHPARQQQEQLLPLTALDRCMSMAAHQKRILFYSHTDVAYPQLLHKLKQSLAEALVHFYPLAGRLKVEEEDGDGVVVECKDQGVMVVEAEVGTRLEDWLTSIASTSALYSRLAYPCAPLLLPLSDTPLLFLQLSRFACGGVALGITFNHHVADGTSLWHFLLSWSQLARLGRVSQPPSCARFLCTQPQPRMPAQLPFYQRVGWRECFSRASQLPSPPSVTRCFHFDKQMILQLKTLANAPKRAVLVAAAAADKDVFVLETDARDSFLPTHAFTSFEAHCAHIWRAVTVARGLPDDARTNFFVSVNCRKRLRSIPEQYLGNAVLFAAASSVVAPLKPRSGFTHAAHLLHKAIVEMTEQKISGTLGVMRQQQKQWSYVVDMDGKRDLQSGSSPRFPVFQIDLGWGAPIAACYATESLREGMLAFMPSQPQGSVDVLICLCPAAMARLQADPHFLSF